MSDQSCIYSVIGDPVGHSLSPEIHHCIRELLGLDFLYDKIQITPGELPGFINQCRCTGKPGFNVTLPHKETIIPLLDEVDPGALKAGAVNTVSHQNGKLIGWNTDITGCSAALRQHNICTAERAVIIGSGGAARAGIVALYDMGCPGVTILCRSIDKAERIIEDLADMSIRISAMKLSDGGSGDLLQSSDLVINATPSGMWPRSDETPLTGPVFAPGCSVMDMIPNPPVTRFLSSAEKQGCKTISGLDMLIHQAIASQAIWQQHVLPKSLFHEIKQYVISKLDQQVVPAGRTGEKAIPLDFAVDRVDPV